jgi:hypothetical protein
MPKLWIYWCVMGLFGLHGNMQAQSDALGKVGVRMSFFDPVVLPLKAGEKVAHLSIPIFFGRSAGLQGAELGTGFTHTRGSIQGLQIGLGHMQRGGLVEGFQFGLLFNKTQGDFKGGQWSGGWSFHRGNFQGWQFSWFGNTVSGGTMEGIQLSHLWNHAGYQGKGLQFTLGLNSASGDFSGVQLGLLSNAIGGALQGIQWSSGLNFAQRNAGIQMGLVNMAVLGGGGLQFGVVNVSGNAHIAPIGLVNVIRKGYIGLEIWGNELMSYNLSLKTGGERVYSVLSLGGNPHAGDPFWSVGWGAGFHFQHSQRFYTDIDMMTHWLHVNRWWAAETGHFTFVNQLRLVCGYALHPKMALFLGPVLQTLVSDQENLQGGNGLGSVLAPDFRTFRGEFGPLNWAWWPGLAGGIRFF